MKLKLKIKPGDIICISSGDGLSSRSELYVGEMTNKALKKRMKEESCEGFRWVQAILFDHRDKWGIFGYDIENGKPVDFPEFCDMDDLINE